MTFYIWDQNNSGGSFRTNDKLCHRVCIEADSYKEAESKALDMGVYYNGVEGGQDCECCGDRWSKGNKVKLPADYSEYDYDKKTYKRLGKSKEIILTTVEDYAQHLANKYGWTTPDARIFYKNGTVKEVFIERGIK